jgi:hypothetical protein
MPDRHPWRVVTRADDLGRQRVSVFTPNTRTAHYLELTLTCGHITSRTYRPATGPTPPRKVRCPHCPKETTDA